MVDVAIDQGGCFETSHATTHTEPIYFVDGVLHYCVSNMPAAVPIPPLSRSPTPPSLIWRSYARKGWSGPARTTALCQGVKTYGGHITYPGVARSQGLSGKSLRP